MVEEGFLFILSYFRLSDTKTVSKRMIHADGSLKVIGRGGIIAHSPKRDGCRVSDSDDADDDAADDVDVGGWFESQLRAGGIGIFDAKARRDG